MRHIVGISDMKADKNEGVIVTFGLGSCIGIVLYDKVNKVAGLVHVMLPDSTEVVNNSNHAKFADTGIKKLLETMLIMGANKKNITAKIAGGANMFTASQGKNLRIGEINYEAVRRNLRKLMIPIIAEDCGKNYGRTLEVDVASGVVNIKTISHGNSTL